MAVTSQTPSVSFTGNGSTTNFAFNFVVPATDTTGTITDATADMSLSSAVLTVDTAGLFYTSDLQGKSITVTGAGASSTNLTTTILSVDSATQLTLNASASTQVTNTTISITTGTYNTTLKNNTDLLVFVDGTQKTITTDYTVRLNLGDDANKQGTVIFNTAPADGAKVVIIRDVTLERTTDFQTGGALTAKSLNAQFDNVIMAVQDTQFDTAASAIKFPSDETLSTTTLPASSSRANKILGFNASGELLMRNDITSGDSASITVTDITSSGTSTLATVDINGGAIDGTTIGATTPAAGTFTNLTASGTITLNGLTYPTSDGTLNQVLSTDGNGVVAFRSIEGLELFTSLTDTPNSYTGQDAKYLKVNESSSTIVFDTLTSDDATQGSNNIYFSTSGATVNTTNLPEGTNLYYTDARADARVNNAIIDEDDFASDSATKVPTQQSTKAYIQSQIETKDNTDEITEGSTNLYYTDARARAAVSVTDAGGDGSLAYNSTTGVITYTGPSASEVRAHISVTDAGGDGSLAYNSTTGVITYTGPSAAEVRAHFTGGTGISITSGDIALDFTEFSTTNITEGTNLYYTDARAQAVSINNVVEDTTPQLGGALDVNGQNITSSSNGNIVLAPNGTGELRVDTGLVEQYTSNGLIITNGAQGSYMDLTPTQYADVGAIFGTGIQVENTGGSGAVLLLHNHKTGDYGYPNIWAHRSRNNAGSVDYLNSGDTAFRFFASGWDGGTTEAQGYGTYTPVASLDFKASENHSASALGGKIEFRTTSDGSTAESLKLTVNNNIELNTDLDVNGYTITSSSNGNIVLAPNGTGDVVLFDNKAVFEYDSGTDTIRLNTPSTAIHINSDNADVDFRIDGDVNDNIFFVNAGTERVGVKITDPSRDLQVNGTFGATTLYGDGSNLDIDLGDLNDVDFSAGKVTGQYVRWDGTSFVSSDIAFTTATLGTDLVTSSVTDNYFVRAGNFDTTSLNDKTYLKFQAGTVGDTANSAVFNGGVQFSNALTMEFDIEDYSAQGGDSKLTIGGGFANETQGDLVTSRSADKSARPVLTFQNLGRKSTYTLDGNTTNQTNTTDDLQYGGAITTARSVAQDGGGGIDLTSFPNANDLVLGAYPVNNIMSSPSKGYDTNVLGDTVIFVGSKQDSAGQETINGNIRQKYQVEEAVRFEGVNSGTLARRTFTISGTHSFVEGEKVTQANSGAIGVVYEATTLSTSVSIVVSSGTFTTNSSDTLTGSSSGATGRYPTVIGSESAGITGSGQATFGVPIVFANKTTTERNALIPTAGMTIFNTTESRIEYYDGSGWYYISGTAV